VAYYRLGQKPQAEQALEVALQLDPNFPNAEEAKKILVALNN
jgi:Tfp pilus assembly protein PilF